MYIHIKFYPKKLDIVRQNEKFTIIIKTLEKVIEQREYLMNLTNIYTKKIMFLESEVTKLMEISVSDDIVIQELSRRKNIYKKRNAIS